jgi:hypothetical protein
VRLRVSFGLVLAPYGDFCWPVSQVLTGELQKNAGMLNRIEFFQSMDAVKSTLIATLIFSIIFLIIAQCFTQFLNYVLIPVCVVVMIFSINLVFEFFTNSTGLRLAIAITLIVITVFIVLAVYKNCYSTRLHAIFLKTATQIVTERKRILLYIIFFLILMVGLIALILFEFVGFWSNGRKIFLPAEYIYYKLYGLQVSALVIVVLAIQLIWGVAFLR